MLSNQQKKWLILTLPALQAVIACVVMLYCSQFSLLSVSASTTLALLSIAAGVLIHKYISEREDQLSVLNEKFTDQINQIDQLHSYAGPIEDICSKSLPIWSRQIETSKSQTEESIIDLSTKFTNMAVRLEEVIANSNKNIEGFSEHDSGLAAVLTESQTTEGNRTALKVNHSLMQTMPRGNVVL